MYSTPLSQSRYAFLPKFFSEYSAPAAAWTLSPKHARYMTSPTCDGIFGEVAPTVMNGMPADWNVGPEARTESVSV